MDPGDQLTRFPRFHPPTLLLTMLRTITECIAGPSRIPSRLPLHPLSLRARPRSRAISTSQHLESGHNRWSKIRHKKGAVDAQRSAIFSRLTNVRRLPALALPSQAWPTWRARHAKTNADNVGNPPSDETPTLARPKYEPPSSSCTYKSKRWGSSEIRYRECRS
jgi:hypothetical protein